MNTAALRWGVTGLYTKQSKAEEDGHAGSELVGSGLRRGVVAAGPDRQTVGRQFIRRQLLAGDIPMLFAVLYCVASACLCPDAARHDAIA